MPISKMYLDKMLRRPKSLLDISGRSGLNFFVKLKKWQKSYDQNFGHVVARSSDALGKSIELIEPQEEATVERLRHPPQKLERNRALTWFYPNPSIAKESANDLSASM